MHDNINSATLAMPYKTNNCRNDCEMLGDCVWYQQYRPSLLVWRARLEVLTTDLVALRSSLPQDIFIRYQARQTRPSSGGGCRGPSKIRQRGGCNNFLLFAR